MKTLMLRDFMDRISELPDALLLKILLLLPTKDVVATMVLSKRWQFLWMMVPRLEYSDDMYQDGEDGRFLRFVYSSLMLHEAPVLESLCLKLGQKSGSIDIGVCVKPAVNRSVRELIIEIDTSSGNDTPVTLPRSFYTSCRMLVTLVLNNAVFLDSHTQVAFPSLKTLELTSMKYPGDYFIYKFLSSCPVLEDLFVEQCLGDNVAILVVRVDSLKFLSLHKTSSSAEDNHQGFSIDAPSLESLDIVDYTDGFCLIERNMPKIVEANLDVIYKDTKQLLGSLTSLEQFALCLSTSKDAFCEGRVFSHLVQLELCTCEAAWLDLLMRLLKDSPKIRFLELEQYHYIQTEDPRPCWKEPTYVPECLLYSLESFVWREYEGSEEEKEVATFILRNSACLEMATFYPKSKDPIENLKMLMELSMSPRSSSSCQLAFHGNYDPVSEE